MLIFTLPAQITFEPLNRFVWNFQESLILL